MNTISLSMTDSDKPLHLVLWQDKTYQQAGDSLVKERIDILEKTIASLNARNDSLEKLVNQLLQRSAYFPPAVYPTPAGLEVRPRGASVVDSAAVLGALINTPAPASAAASAASAASAAVDDDAANVGIDAEDSEVEDADAEDDADAAEDEDEAMELEEFEWKGMTYYRDSENQVYHLVDGDLDDTPIGVWSEEKKKLLKYGA